MAQFYVCAFIWRQSGINREITSGGIENIYGWFLCDSVHGLRTNLTTPITFQATPGQRRYNLPLHKVRQTIECTFGIQKNRSRYTDKTRGTLSYTVSQRKYWHTTKPA